MSPVPLLRGFSFDMSDRVVLVTGASSGIGRRFGRILAASGAKVVLAARRLALLDELRKTIEADGGTAIAVAMDAADEAATIAAYDTAEAAFGPIDSVVANAGINSSGSLLDLSVEEFDQLMDVNVRGTFLTVREGARRMIKAGSVKRRHGRIVIISSITAQHVSRGLASYSGSKAAILQFGRVAAKDWANKGINVNTICPGYMRTELTDEWFESASGKRFIAEFPRQRIMDIDALDPILLYLCSDASAQVTGSSITIDDGQSL